MDPWKPPAFIYSSAGPWQEYLGEIPVLQKPGESSAVVSFDYYVVESTRGGEVAVREIILETGSDTVLLDDKYRVVPGERGVFHGPFWIDPRQLRDVKVGDKIVMGTPEKPEVFEVYYIGELDISPLSRGESNSIATQGDCLVPVPKDTIRDIVVLSTKDERGNKYRLVVDRETGLVIFSSSSTLRGGATNTGQLRPLKNMVTFKILAEATLDLEDRLPPYRNYRLDPILRAGYYVKADTAALGLSGGYILRWNYYVTGMYKDRALVLELIIAVDYNMRSVMETALWLVDLENYDAEVVSSRNILRQVGEKYDYIPLLVGPLEGRETLNLFRYEYARVASSSDTVEYEITTPSNEMRIVKLFYTPNGLLKGFIPLIVGPEQGLQIAPQTLSNIDIISRVYVEPEYPQIQQESQYGEEQQKPGEADQHEETRDLEGLAKEAISLLNKLLGRDSNSSASQSSSATTPSKEHIVETRESRRTFYYTAIIILLILNIALLRRRRK